MRRTGLLLLGLLLAACGSGGETGLHVVAQWSDVTVDQLEYVVTNSDGALVHSPQRLPATVSGALSSGADAVIVLGGGMEGQRVQCQVTGLLSGVAVRRGQAAADLPSGALAEVRVTLSVDVPPGSDGGAPLPDARAPDGPSKIDARAPDARVTPPPAPDAMVDAPTSAPPDAPVMPGLGQNGEACASATTCRSGFCADGVCCDTACTATCQTCNRMGRLGSCGNAAAGTRDGRCATQDPSTCGLDGSCAAGGVCQRYQPGTSCAGAVCAGNVLDGSSTCDGAGTCLGGTPHSCSPYVCDPMARACKDTCAGDQDCIAPRTCEGGQCGVFRPLGQSCGNGADCASGNCVDGVCCSSASCETCFACDVNGSAGTCQVSQSGRPDPHGRCPTQQQASCGLNGTCNGQGACASYPDGTSCRMGRICLGGMCR